MHLSTEEPAASRMLEPFGEVGGDVTEYFSSRTSFAKIEDKKVIGGAQWLSGRVLDSRPKGRGFEPHRRHCVVVLEQDTFILA